MKFLVTSLLILFLFHLPSSSKNYFICSTDEEASSFTMYSVEYRFGNGDVLWSISCPGIGGTCGNTSCNAGFQIGDDPIYE